MTDTTTPEPHRARRPARSRRPLPIRRRRRNRAVRPPLAAAAALARLAADGDVYKVRGSHYLVARIDDDLLDTVIAALGSVEDDEASIGTPDDREQDTGDDEPSIGTLDDLESDGDADAEPSLGADALEGDPCDAGEPSAFEPKPADLGIRMMRRDNIIRKRSRRSGGRP